MHGLFRQRWLPHWDVDDGTYFVTACLEGSISSQGIGELRRFRDELENRLAPVGMSLEAWNTMKHKLVFARMDELLDGNPAVRHFDDQRLADEVRKSMYHFAGERYSILAWCIMPSHFHWVFHPLSDWCQSLISTGDRRSPREIIMHSIKSFTSNQCNRLLQSSDKFWQQESYDHWIRDEDELWRVIGYVEQNPVNAGLVTAAEQWRFSSAFDRREWGLARDQALKPPTNVA